MDIRKLFIYLFIYFIFWIFWSFSKLDKNGGRVCWRCDREVTDPGEGSGGEWLIQGRGPGPPVIFRPNWDPKGGKNFFWRPAPPRPYLRAWIRYCTRNGLKVVPQTKVKLKVVSTIDDRSDLSDEMANLCAKLPLYEVDKGELDLTHMNQETRVPTKAC